MGTAMRRTRGARSRWVETIIGLTLVVATPIIACSNAKPPPSGQSGEEVTVEQPPVQVLVGKAIVPDGVRYRYYVVNGSAFPIVSLLVGFDDPHGEPELTQPPVGWDGDLIPATSVESPPGWEFEVTPMEESPLVSLSWSVDTTQTESRQILGGQSLGGFTVLVSQEDLAYETGHWSVYLNTSEEVGYYGSLQPEGTVAVPPSSVFAHAGLSLAPNPAREGIRIDFTVPAAGPVSVDIFDISGRRIRNLFHRSVAKGSVSWTWDGRDAAGTSVSPGTYFVRVRFPGGERFSRVTWVK